MTSPFQRGMLGSEAAGLGYTEGEKDEIRDAVIACARTMADFTTDAVWARVPDIEVTKGMSAILNGLARRGFIKNTLTLRRSTRGGAHDHGQRLSVWTRGPKIREWR